MARRPRDYKAEYAARKARHQSRYGTSYGKFRTLQTRAKAQGIPAEEFRKQAFREATTQGDLRRIRRVLDTMAQARDETHAIRSGNPPDSVSGRIDAHDLYDAWADEFDAPEWFFYHP